MRRVMQFALVLMIVLPRDGRLAVPLFDVAQIRGDDGQATTGVNQSRATTAKHGQSPQKPKKDDARQMQLRAQRARARRAAVALDDQYGPGAGNLASSSAGWVPNGGASGAFSPFSTGGSSGFGSPFGLGSSSGNGTSTGGSIFSTGSGGSNVAGTGAGNATAGNANASGGGSTQVPDLNARVLQFAQMNLGKQVGNGQCWELGAQALDYAGAEPPHGYVFGASVPLSQAIPGDVLEFYNAHFVGAGYWMMLGTPYHTAIVDSVQGSTITMLNQNVNHSLRVQTTVIDMADLVGGSVTVYRPVARSGP